MSQDPSALHRKTILFCAMNYAPELVGCGRYSGEIGAHLAEQGHQVTVVTTHPHYPEWKFVPGSGAGGYRRESLDGVEVIRCPMFVGKTMGGLWRAIAPLTYAMSSAPVTLWAALRRRPQVVLAVEPSIFTAPVALLAAKLSGARSVLHVQDLEVEAAFNTGHLSGATLRNFALRVEASLLRKFDAVVTISNTMRRKLEEKGVAGDRISVVRNWVDLALIHPQEAPNIYRQELDLEGRFVVLYAGSIGRKQALDVLLDAVASLADRNDICLVVAGDGPHAAPLREKYKGLVNVRFLPLQPEERLCDLLNLADIQVLPQDRGVADLVLPSKLGGMLASGRPLIVMADPGTELHDVLDGVADIVEPGSASTLAAAIRAAANRPRNIPYARGLEKAEMFDRGKNLKKFGQALLASLS